MATITPGLTFMGIARDDLLDYWEIIGNIFTVIYGFVESFFFFFLEKRDAWQPAKKMPKNDT